MSFNKELTANAEAQFVVEPKYFEGEFAVTEYDYPFSEKEVIGRYTLDIVKKGVIQEWVVYHDEDGMPVKVWRIPSWKK